MGQGGVKGIEAGAGIGAGIGGMYAGLPGAGVGAAVGAAVGATPHSPLRLEHAMRGFTAGVGDYASSLVAPFFKGNSAGKNIGYETAYNTPVVGPLARSFTSPGIDNQMLSAEQQFYNRAAQTSQAYRTYNALLKQNPDQAAAYFAAHRDDVWQGKLSTSLQLQLGKINAFERQVQAARDMDDKTRQDTLRTIYNAKKSVLDSFNGLLSSQNSSKPLETSPMGNATR